MIFRWLIQLSSLILCSMYVLFNFIFGSIIESNLSLEVSLVTPKNYIIQNPISKSSSYLKDPAFFSRNLFIYEFKDK